MAQSDVFVTRRGAPKLVRCAVLFIDLLGVRAMNRGPVRDVRRDLVALEQAVSQMYRDYLKPESPWPAAFFSDTLVLAAPVTDKDGEQYAIDGLILQAAWLQLTLLASGFFVRGGLSLGWFHIDNGLIFGPALADAYELESRHAVYPRVVISKDAEASLRHDPRRAFGAVEPLGRGLLCDGDGWTFVDYLELLLDALDDPVVAIEVHRDHVIDRLDRHRDDKRVWEKYRWVAEYHNAFVDRVFEGAAEARVPVDAMAWRFEPFA